MTKLVILHKTKIRLIISSITLVIISLFVFAPKIYAATLFEDNFDSGNANKWIVFGDLGWNVQNGQYGIHLDPGLSNTVPDNTNWNYNWTQIVYTVDLTGNAGVDKNILLKFHDTSNFIELHANDHGIYLDKAVNQGGANLGFTPTILQNGITYHFKSEINNDKIKVYLDNNLIFDVTETNPVITNWKIGLRAGTGATSPTEVWFDNVVVTDLPVTTPTPTPTPLPNLNVLDIKQYTPPWSSQVYDHAASWSTNPTINRWGCALTAADMILQYYGFQTDPGNLNTWLNSQSDGYVRNGLLNWLAISRYSKLNSSITRPSLEFIRLSNINQNVINELNNNRPAILEEPGHFVVAKSQTQTSFGINDPGYSNRPTLASYGNNFNSIEAYRPSHTDLSYIMLTVDPQFDLKVTDTNMNEIIGNTFLQNPLIDDINNTSTSGTPLKIFEFPKPVNGNYKVQITGNGIYELDSYLYDSNGNVGLNKTNGILGNNQTDEYQVMIGQGNSITQKVTIDQIIQDWEDAKNQNKIKNPFIYSEIKIALEFARKIIKVGDKKLARLTLQGIKSLFRVYSPRYIDSTVSTILQSEVQILINSL